MAPPRHVGRISRNGRSASTFRVPPPQLSHLPPGRFHRVTSPCSAARQTSQGRWGTGRRNGHPKATATFRCWLLTRAARTPRPDCDAEGSGLDWRKSSDQHLLRSAIEPGDNRPACRFPSHEQGRASLRIQGGARRRCRASILTFLSLRYRALRIGLRPAGNRLCAPCANHGPAAWDRQYR